MKKNLEKLLLPNIDNSNNIGIVKKTMKKYISSAWNYKTQKVIPMIEYNKFLKKYKISPDKTNKNFCRTSNKITKLLCQAHGGNLLEHSQWCALQLYKWYLEKHKIVKGLSLELLIVSGFFHDIAKSGDCVETCENDVCWRDMYSDKKYGKSGDNNHPKWCGDVILGRTTYLINCQNGEELSIPDLIEKNFDVDLKEVALAAYMHWELGRINIVNEIPLEKKYKIYLQRFKKYCKLCNLDMTERRLRLCLAVGAADVSSATNFRVRNLKYKAMKMKFLSKDPWSFFKFNRKFNKYMTDIIDKFKIELKQNK